MRNAVSDVSSNSLNLICNEKPMKPEDIIAEKTEKYVCICLGLNDLSSISPDKYIELYKQLLDNMQTKNPGKIIVILSVTPLVSGKSGGSMNNNVITEVNNMLSELANDRDIQFIDWAKAIRDDEDNSLYENLSSDGYCHLNIEAYNRLVEFLLRNPVEMG